MHPLLSPPINGGLVNKKRAAIRRELLARPDTLLDKNIAVLGGSTTQDICALLELFLLNIGIRPHFYQSEFGRYWQDAVFPNPALKAFSPDLIFIHTSLRNLAGAPTPRSTPAQAAGLLQAEYARFEQMWQALAQSYTCPIIQNNFEPPFYRLLGNSDAADVRGLTNFSTQLNQLFYSYAQNHENFYIHDINRLAAEYGLAEWASPSFWHLYKYALAPNAMPAFAANLAHIIGSLYGKNKKVLVLDLDNTLWGGVVGDDGPEGIEIGHETPMGELYSEFQQYIKAHKDLGVLLAVASKNDEANALAGLAHPEGTLRQQDFSAIRANWQPKNQSLAEIAEELNLGTDSLVFVDDNPAERELVRGSGLGAAVPELDIPQNYVHILDQCGFFEVTSLTGDDAARGEMMRQNAERLGTLARFASYQDYLASLEMKAVIKPFEPLYLPRIAQLTGKSNQFNLTTRRYTQAQLQAMAQDATWLTLYGKLADKFGDNGVVCVVAGHMESGCLRIDLWLMSCRVLKRGMEDAMMDELVRRAKAAGVHTLVGEYLKTEKNGMVKDFYAQYGFSKTEERQNGDALWRLETADYRPKNPHIEVEKNDP